MSEELLLESLVDEAIDATEAEELVSDPVSPISLSISSAASSTMPTAFRSR